MYVIVRVSDGWYVATAGSAGSYTPKLQNARRFATRESAERELCPESERVIER